MLKRYAVFESSILKWLIAVLLLAIPLYPKFPLFNVPGTYVAIRIEDFLISFIGLFLFLKILSNPKVFLKDRINQAFFIFFTVGFISVVSGIFLTQTVTPHIAALHWLRRIEYIIPLFTASLIIRSDFPKFFVQVLMVSSFLVFIYALGQIHLGWPVISTQNLEFSKGLALKWIPGARLHSTFAGHYDLSAFLVIVLPLFWAYLFAVKRAFEKMIVFGVIGTSFWLLLASSSRISVVAYFIGVCVALWLLGRKKFIIPIFLLSFLLMLTMSDLTVRYRYSIDAILQRVQQVFSKQSLVVSPVFAQSDTSVVAPLRKSSSTPEPSPISIIEDRSTEIRLNVEWPRAIRSFFKNPLLGTGYSSITLATDSDYLRLLGEVGLLGVLSFLLILVRIWKRLQRTINNFTGEITEQRAFLSGSVGSLAGILINAAFIDVFEASKVALIIWTVVGISVAIANEVNNKKAKV